MQDNPKQKLDGNLAQLNTLHKHQHLTHNQPLQVNLFLPITDIHLDKLQSPLDQPEIPNIQEQKTKSSRLNQNSQQQNTKGNEKKKKHLQKSEHYHRDQNSRRIKTKKVTKDYLQRSQYFYAEDINEGGPDGPIMSLLNEYEAFQQRILNACFERRVIKLSHYGNRNKIKKNSTQEVSFERNFPSNIHQQRSRSFENYPKLTNNLSKSVVQNPPPKLVTRPQVVQYKKQSQSPQLNYVRNPMIHSVELGSITDPNMNKKLMYENNISKHMTPVRTIYLKQGQKKFNLYPNHTNKSSPIQNVSYLTPLGSGRSQIKYKLKPFKSIMQDPIYYEPHQQNQMKDHIHSSGGANSFQNSTYNKYYGISVFSAKKNNDFYKPQCNIKMTETLKHGVNNKSRTMDEMILTQQITLPHNSHKHQCIHNFSDLKKFSVTLTSQQSQSRSRSKRGLSLTQSVTKFKSKLQFIKKSNKSITSSANKKQTQKSDILDKKLNVGSSTITKRVQIRIY